MPMIQGRISILLANFASVVGISASQVCNAADVTAPIKLVASDARAYDVGATCLALAANQLAIGVRGRDDGGVNRGAVYLFSESASGWAQYQKVTPALPVDHEEFGEAVALTSGWLGIGGPKSDRNGIDSGTAWIFQSNGANFVEIARLASPTSVIGGSFGCSVAFNVSAAQPVMVIGAQREIVSGIKSGAVHVFERTSDGSWNSIARLNATGVPTENDEFGHTVSISGNRIFVGMPGDDTTMVNAGSVFVFVRSGSSWLFEAELFAPNPQELAEFGANISASGDRIAVGSYREDGTFTNCGRVHLFVRGQAGWTLEQTLESPVPNVGGEFGCSLSLDGDSLAIGADQESNSAIKSGKTHLFRHSTSGQWIPVASIHSTQSQSQEFAGVTVGVSSGHVAFGAPFRSGSNPYEGSAFVVNLSADCDSDFIPDLAEIASGAFDCNENAIPDSCDIAAGMPDTNGNGVPDQCEVTPCLGDIVQTGFVDAVDLATILAVWGTNGNPYPRADTNHDGIVDGLDLTFVLTGWGPCAN